MALLDIIWDHVGLQMPVVFYREPWQPWKYEFQDEIIRRYQMEVYYWSPYDTAFQQEGDEFEVQNYYRVNNQIFTCPTGIAPPDSNTKWTCALDIYNRPKCNGIATDWDSIFVGHKGCDSDPILGGDAGTRVDAKMIPMPGHMTALYPLRGWSHDDVFEYCEKYDVPIQTSRYEKIDGKWGEREDKKYNCDYVHACTACIDRRPDAEKFPMCPKLGMRIENISSMVKWDTQEKFSHMKD